MSKRVCWAKRNVSLQALGGIFEDSDLKVTYDQLISVAEFCKVSNEDLQKAFTGIADGTLLQRRKEDLARAKDILFLKTLVAAALDAVEKATVVAELEGFETKVPHRDLMAKAQGFNNWQEMVCVIMCTCDEPALARALKFGKAFSDACSYLAAGGGTVPTGWTRATKTVTGKTELVHQNGTLRTGSLYFDWSLGVYVEVPDVVYYPAPLATAAPQFAAPPGYLQTYAPALHTGSITPATTTRRTTIASTVCHVTTTVADAGRALLGMGLGLVKEARAATNPLLRQREPPTPTPPAPGAMPAPAADMPDWLARSVRGRTVPDAFASVVKEAFENQDAAEMVSSKFLCEKVEVLGADDTFRTTWIPTAAAA